MHHPPGQYDGTDAGGKKTENQRDMPASCLKMNRESGLHVPPLTPAKNLNLIDKEK
jgi:hypothetical protein